MVNTGAQSHGSRHCLAAFALVAATAKESSATQMDGYGLAYGDTIDPNCISEVEFTLLPGVGPKLSERIVAFRNEHGPFSSTDDLLHIRGIGTKTLAAISIYMRVGTNTTYPCLEGAVLVTYLDHNATSPLLGEVLDAMTPWFGIPANPASAHRRGQAAAMAVDEAREQVARLINGDPTGVVFTSGATEANHLFIRGSRNYLNDNQLAYAVSEIEHPCVLAAADALRTSGINVVTMNAKKDGRITLPDHASPPIGLLSIMAANHETGVIQPFKQAMQWCQRSGAKIHIDATQAAGRIPLDLGGADGVVLSAHKIGGPGGVGALVLPDGEPYPVLMGGGAQERGRRAGTVNTAGVVGFGVACDIAARQMDARTQHWSVLRDYLCPALVALGAQITGSKQWRTPFTLRFRVILGKVLSKRWT